MFSRLRSRWRRVLGGHRAYRFHLRYWFDPDVDLAAGVLATMRPARAARQELCEGPTQQRIVVLAPHPDDEVMGPGGTLLKAKRRGASVDIIYLTDGTADPAEAVMRRAEGEHVADRLGFGARFLGLPAITLSASPSAVDSVAQALRDATPDVLFVPFVLDDNDDHRATSRILADAAAAAGLNPGIEVWAYQVYGALPGNVLVPLGSAAGEKSEAIRLYQSQSEIRDWAHYALGLNAANTRFAPRSCKDPYLEAFYVLPLSDYVELVMRFPAPR